jgi:hypothetical protein
MQPTIIPILFSLPPKLKEIHLPHLVFSLNCGAGTSAILSGPLQALFNPTDVHFSSEAKVGENWGMALESLYAAVRDGRAAELAVWDA